MSEDVSQSRREPGRFSRAVIILIGVSLLVPHTLMFTWSISRVVNTATFVLVAVCWIILRHDILTVVDTNSTTLLQFPYGGALFSSIILFISLSFAPNHGS